MDNRRWTRSERDGNRLDDFTKRYYGKFDFWSKKIADLGQEILSEETKQCPEWADTGEPWPDPWETCQPGSWEQDHD